MTDPYAYDSAEDNKPPALTLMTLIGLLFVAFIVFQVSDTIGKAHDRLDTVTLQEGDTFRYDHVARYDDDGTLYSTSEEDVAIAANRATRYTLVPQDLQPTTEPLDFENFTWGEKAARALEGRFVGETVRIKLEPQEGPFALEPFVGGQGIDRHFFEFAVRDPITFTQGEDLGGGETFDVDNFLAEQEAQLGEPIVDGERVNIGYDLVPYHIIYDIDRDAGTITIITDIQDGRSYPVENLSAAVTTILSSDGGSVRFRLDIEEGTVFSFAGDEEIFQQIRGTWINVHRQDIWRVGTYQVLDVTDDRIFLGHTPNPDPGSIGRTLILDITVLSKGADDTQQ